MKTFLNAKISVKTLLIVACVIACSMTAIAAAPSIVQATLSPDITVKFNGEVQELKDANGNVIYPVLYNGSTYLPLRALCNMIDLPVDWVGDTRTVILGSAELQPKAFKDIVTKQGENGVGSWTITTNKSELPALVDDFGNKLPTQYSSALKADGMTTLGSSAKSVFDIAAGYHTLSFTAYTTDGLDPLNKGLKITITNADNNIQLWSYSLERGKSIEAEVDISGVTRLKFEAEVITATSSAQKPANALYLCDPMVK